MSLPIPWFQTSGLQVGRQYFPIVPPSFWFLVNDRPKKWIEATSVPHVTLSLWCWTFIYMHVSSSRLLAYLWIPGLGFAGWWLIVAAWTELRFVCPGCWVCATMTVCVTAFSVRWYYVNRRAQTSLLHFFWFYFLWIKTSNGKGSAAPPESICSLLLVLSNWAGCSPATWSFQPPQLVSPPAIPFPLRSAKEKLERIKVTFTKRKRS